LKCLKTGQVKLGVHENDLHGFRRAVEFAREKGIGKLLIDVREIEGIDVPEIGHRYWLSSEIAMSAKGAVKIVMIARPEFIDPQKIGVTIAANRNLNLNIFYSEADALAWLLAP